MTWFRNVSELFFAVGFQRASTQHEHEAVQASAVIAKASLEDHWHLVEPERADEIDMAQLYIESAYFTELVECLNRKTVFLICDKTPRFEVSDTTDIFYVDDCILAQPSPYTDSVQHLTKLPRVWWVGH